MGTLVACAVVKRALKVNETILAGWIIVRRTHQSGSDRRRSILVQMTRVIPEHGANHLEYHRMDRGISNGAARFEKLNHRESRLGDIELFAAGIHSRAGARCKRNIGVAVREAWNSRFHFYRRIGYMVLRLRRPDGANDHVGDARRICGVGGQWPLQDRSDRTDRIKPLFGNAPCE